MPLPFSSDMPQPTRSDLRPDAPAPAGRERYSGRLVALAVLSSLLASSCCVLPLVLVLAGITGAWMTKLTALQPVTPLFNGIALAALAWAGYLLFRPQAACAAPQDAGCADTRRGMRRIFFAAAAFIAALLLFPLFAPYFY